MGKTSIQWTDWTFNPWVGCRKVAPECANCYAEILDKNRFSKTLGTGTKEHPVSHWGSGPRHRTSASNWKQPLKWNARPLVCGFCNATYALEGMRDGMQCINNLSKPGSGAWRCHGRVHRGRVFCASLADWLDDENVPIEWLADLLKLIHDTPNLDWLLLTKRPQNWENRVAQAAVTFKAPMEKGTPHSWMWGWLSGVAPANVWFGVSAGADQAAALDIPARVHFLSCEPMLEPLNTTHAVRFSWVIFGGESGSKARECHTDWIRDSVEFCRANNVTPFVKQLGSNCVAAGRDQNNPIAMKDSHGGNMDEWPEDLRVREFPTPR